jgi:energy-coupling factor transporter ATP-binding protein EcfA2
MKLYSIEVEGFGALSELTIAALVPGLNVIYGSNGSGKTTLLQFVRGVLCGFDEGRRIGLLPPSDGRVGGGSLKFRWEGDVYRFLRRDEAAVVDSLRVSLVRSDLEMPHPRFAARQLRTDLVPLLYSVGNNQAHTLDRLVVRARQDGIQLAGRPQNSAQLRRAAAHIEDERFALLHNSNSGLIAELTQRRQNLQSEVDRLCDDLRQRCRQCESARGRRPQGDILHWHHQVTWLRSELAAAESDLREAQDRRWMPQAATPVITRGAAPSRQHSPPAPLHHPHLDRQRVHRLQQLDRRIDLARTLLAEAARARLDISLRSARIAGSDDTAPGPFLKQVRDSLKSLEIGVLELRDEAGHLSAQHTAERCVCDQWQASTQGAVTELSRKLYQLCEQVSRNELRHQKSLLGQAEETIRDSELQLLQHLESLRTQRLALLEASGAPLAWKGRAQTGVEDDNCECLEHELRQSWRLPRRVAASRPAAERFARPMPPVVKRPSTEQVQQLLRRVEELRGQLAAAVAGWRRARNWHPQTTLPADIHKLEETLDRTRRDLNLVESRLTASQQRWRVLSLTGEVIRRTLETLDQQRQPTVIQWASGYLQELTGGRQVAVVVGEDDRLEVIAADGTAQPHDVLSRGTRDQLALSLRLALVRAYKARGVSFPLILDDVLVDTDHRRLQSAVILLQQFAREHSQQIIYLTCQTHLTALFEQQHVALRTLPGSDEPVLRTVSSANEARRTIRGWIDRRKSSAGRTQRPGEKPSHRANTPATPHNRIARAKRNIRLLKPLHRRQPDGPYWLSMDAPASLVPSIGSQMGRRLAGLGVRTTGDLIDLVPDEMSLRLNSLQITPRRLRQWQAEAALLCCVPDLTGPDGQLLAEAGIAGIDQLADSSVHDLQQAMAGLADGLRVGPLPGPPVVQRWIHSARRARRIADARRLSRHARLQEPLGGTGVGGSGRRTPSRTVSAHAGEPAGRRRHRLIVQRRRVRAAQESSRTTPSAGPSTQEPEPIVRPFVPLKAFADRQEARQQWRFYLSLESPVVDAPSIGPTTARRLSRIGVITVADLLNRPATEIALRLKNRRIKEQTVLLWQQQARLMCRIPQLRGHDAQVLVACDITEPERVASMRPEDLFAVVGPFVETIEGQRLLRSSNTPDLSEVSDWIHWARHSRTLRAA